MDDVPELMSNTKDLTSQTSMNQLDVQRVRLNRFRVLHRLYIVTGGNLRKRVPLKELVSDLDIDAVAPCFRRIALEFADMGTVMRMIGELG